ncbi:MAG: carbon dioxide concentrating mechanism protein [Leptolyngbyaceae cyanobacterium SM1_3_5]|nr:carbon dioxide concentrating mechanism protein [Leptolyngbyaceae cyanobacterium SM1_3_5]
MQLPLHPICNEHFCVSGDVSIAPTATIAPGVLLQADPGSRLVIAADVCIGMGSVVHAHQGMLEIASGATLGAGVLVIGGNVGINACIGARSTLWNVEIAPDQIVAADSLIGEMEGQNLPQGGFSQPVIPAIEPPAIAPEPTESAAEVAIMPPTVTDPILQNPPLGGSAIYGKAGLNRLMGALFPYREMLNGSPPNSEDSDST